MKYWVAVLLVILGSCAIHAQEPPFGVTAGFSYIASKEGGPGHADVRGGYIQPAVNLGYGLAAYGDFAFHSGVDPYGQFSLQSYTAGLSKRVANSPFGAAAIFGEVGDTRVSYHTPTGVYGFGSNRVQNGFTFMTGAEFAVPLSPQLALSMTPFGVVVRNHVVDPTTSINASGDTSVGYFAKVGLSFYFGGRGYRRY